MTISPAGDELLRECTVPIIKFGQKAGYGFFVAPNKLLTCFHVISVDGMSFEIANDIKIQWRNQILPAQVTGIDEEVDLALLSVELTGHHSCLPLNEDVVSFEVLYVPGHTTLTVKGFAGDAEKIMFEVYGDDIGCHPECCVPMSHTKFDSSQGINQSTTLQKKDSVESICRC